MTTLNAVKLEGADKMICPSCSMVLGFRFSPADKQPRAGDPAACTGCKAILHFKPDGGIELMPKEKILAWKACKPVQFQQFLTVVGIVNLVLEPIQRTKQVQNN